MENQELPNPADNHDDDDRYEYTKARVIDIILGLLGGIGYIILAVMVMTFFKWETIWWFFAILMVIYIGIILFYFRNKRKYIAIGLIFAVTVLPAIVGGCLYLIS
jgi:hypothetical protein